jgi:F-type H+-transporting ATPase subunit b|tara:strand:+ start:266 stop:763 length:498 start_codon:yes stop_codon:yes gene_type:complete
MIIDATFWVAISFFIFIGGLIYLKIPHKINNSLTNQINEMKKEIEEAKKLKIEAKDLLSNYEGRIGKSKKETQEIIKMAAKDSEKIILEETEKFHISIENKKKNAEQKIIQMKKKALRDIRNVSIKISMEAIEHLIKNSIDKNKLEKIYTKSLEQAKVALKHSET